MQISALQFSTMLGNYHNVPNLAQIAVHVVPWGLSKHIREIPIISNWQDDLNVSPRDLFVRYIHFLLCNHHQPRKPNNHKMWGCMDLAIFPMTGKVHVVRVWADSYSSHDLSCIGPYPGKYIKIRQNLIFHLRI